MKPIRPIHDDKIKNYERVLDRSHDILNGGVSLGGMNSLGGTNSPGNIDCVHVSATSPGAANTDFAVTHNLNRIPSGFMVTLQNAAAHFYGGGTPWTTSQIFLKCDTINVTANFLIF